MYVEGFIDFGEDVDELGQEEMFEQGRFTAWRFLCFNFGTQTISSLHSCPGDHKMHLLASV
jgi:hypothetical protein